MVVLLVRLEVLGEVEDALGQERDLHLGRAGIALVGAELLDDGRLLRFVVQRPLRHFAFPCFPPHLRRPGGRASGRSFSERNCPEGAGTYRLEVRWSSGSPSRRAGGDASSDGISGS